MSGQEESQRAVFHLGEIIIKQSQTISDTSDPNQAREQTFSEKVLCHGSHAESKSGIT